MSSNKEWLAQYSTEDLMRVFNRFAVWVFNRQSQKFPSQQWRAVKSVLDLFTDYSLMSPTLAIAIKTSDLFADKSIRIDQVSDFGRAFPARKQDIMSHALKHVKSGKARCEQPLLELKDVKSLIKNFGYSLEQFPKLLHTAYFAAFDYSKRDLQCSVYQIAYLVEHDPNGLAAFVRYALAQNYQDIDELDLDGLYDFPPAAVNAFHKLPTKQKQMLAKHFPDDYEFIMRADVSKYVAPPEEGWTAVGVQRASDELEKKNCLGLTLSRLSVNDISFIDNHVDRMNILEKFASAKIVGVDGEWQTWLVPNKNPVGMSILQLVCGTPSGGMSAYIVDIQQARAEKDKEFFVRFSDILKTPESPILLGVSFLKYDLECLKACQKTLDDCDVWDPRLNLFESIHNYVEMSELTGANESILGACSTGLSGIVKHITGIEIDKSQQSGFWLHRPLSSKAMLYAVLDGAAEVLCAELIAQKVNPNISVEDFLLSHLSAQRKKASKSQNDVPATSQANAEPESSGSASLTSEDKKDRGEKPSRPSFLCWMPKEISGKSIFRKSKTEQLQFFAMFNGVNPLPGQYHRGTKIRICFDGIPLVRLLRSVGIDAEFITQKQNKSVSQTGFFFFKDQFSGAKFGKPHIVIQSTEMEDRFAEILLRLSIDISQTPVESKCTTCLSSMTNISVLKPIPNSKNNFTETECAMLTAMGLDTVSACSSANGCPFIKWNSPAYRLSSAIVSQYLQFIQNCTL